MALRPREVLLEVLLGVLDIDQRRGRLDARVADDDHDVRVRCESVDERAELAVLHLHALELGLRLAAAQLELLDDVADLFEPVSVELVDLALRCGVRDDEKRRALEEHDFVGVRDAAEVVEVGLEQLRTYTHV